MLGREIILRSGGPLQPFGLATPTATRTRRRTRHGLGSLSPQIIQVPAAHGCFSAASTDTLTHFFGSGEVGFSVDSTVAGVRNPVRTYFHFSDALTEVLDARIYGGMHYRNSTRIGATIGMQVSRFTTRHFFRPAKHRGNKPNEE